MKSFDRFLNEDIESDAESDFEAILEPSTDFYPGSLLVSNPKALKASQREVERRIKKADPKVNIDWSGTIGTVRRDGDTVDRIEIHGATYSNKTGEAAGVRFDATGVKINKDQS